MISRLYGILQVIGGDVCDAHWLEMLNEFAIVFSHENERVAFLFDQFVNLAVVIAFG